MSKMYLRFDRTKTHLVTVLHTLAVCESQRIVYLWLYLKDGVSTLDRFPPSVERDQAVMETGGVSVW